jgi:hypothetical protein
MANKDEPKSQNGDAEFAVVSIEILTAHFGGDAYKAERTMQKIGEAGGFGRPSPSSIYSLGGASDEIQKAAREIIRKAETESKK